MPHWHCPHFAFIYMENQLSNYLKWYKRHPDLPTTKLDRAVSKLRYIAGGNDSEIGMVCETANGEFWCFTTNPVIQCPRSETYLKHYKTQYDAESFLFKYALSELIRLMKLNSDVPYVLTKRFKRRDRSAFDSYTAIPENRAHTDVEQAFKCGMDWILRSEGVQRRPSWANYLVQHNNGTQSWFEDKPSVNDQTGFWESKSGRNKNVQLHTESWRASIVKLT